MSDIPEEPVAPEENFFTHLVELRDRIIKASISVIVLFFGMVYWAPDIFQLLARPLLDVLPKGAHMIVTDVTGSFFVPIKVTLMAAFVLALPVVIYQVWAFVAPGLYQHEKKLVIPLVNEKVPDGRKRSNAPENAEVPSPPTATLRMWEEGRFD